eukprot:s3499_g10.t1
MKLRKSERHTLPNPLCTRSSDYLKAFELDPRSKWTIWTMSIDTASHSAQPLTFKPFVCYYSILLTNMGGFDHAIALLLAFRIL